MRQIETPIPSLPVALNNRPRSFTRRDETPVAFLSQLIAERHHLAPQRAKRRAPVGDVLRTYDAGGRISDRRLPPGYRMSRDV
jgi:hypothetical protein